MFFYFGMISMIGFITIVLSFIKVSDSYNEDGRKKNRENELFSSFYAFRFLLLINLTVFFVGIAVRILRAHKVNYMFIFDLDP